MTRGVQGPHRVVCNSEPPGLEDRSNASSNEAKIAEKDLQDGCAGDERKVLSVESIHRFETGDPPLYRLVGADKACPEAPPRGDV